MSFLYVKMASLWRGAPISLCWSAATIDKTRVGGSSIHSASIHRLSRSRVAGMASAAAAAAAGEGEDAPLARPIAGSPVAKRARPSSPSSAAAAAAAAGEGGGPSEGGGPGPVASLLDLPLSALHKIVDLLGPADSEAAGARASLARTCRHFREMVQFPWASVRLSAHPARLVFFTELDNRWSGRALASWLKRGDPVIKIGRASCRERVYVLV